MQNATMVPGDAVQQVRKVGLRRVQKWRKRALIAAAAGMLATLPLVHSLGVGESGMHEWVEAFGLMLILTAIFGRTWCMMYVGGRKSAEIVATGPYSISRNPLYFFSLAAVFGIGLQSGSLVMGLLALAIGLAIFSSVIREEEKALSPLFGAPYADYLARVPRLWPKFSLWRDSDYVTVHSRLLRRTFCEALLFLLAIPICELVDRLQDAGIIVPLLHLP